MTDASHNLLGGDRLLTPAEVAALFRVDPKTVTRWATPHEKTGVIRLKSKRTPGGHRRYLESEVRALVEQQDEQSAGGDSDVRGDA